MNSFFVDNLPEWQADFTDLLEDSLTTKLINLLTATYSYKVIKQTTG